MVYNIVMPAKLLELSELQHRLVQLVRDSPRDVAKRAVMELGVTRQAVNHQLRRLVERGFLTTEGQTRNRAYGLVTLAKSAARLPVTEQLEEHVIWQEQILPFVRELPENVQDICSYGCTEMLNNVKDHSGSSDVFVSVSLNAAELELRVSDSGMGIFRKIKEACQLEDEREAILELVKGKFTTDPERHTGEGIFFTSRAFDRFALISGVLTVIHHRQEEDWLIQDANPLNGTYVFLRIAPWSPHTLREVFDRYSTDQDDYAFRRTHVIASLARSEGEKLVSRSQAKRVLARLERFREVILDFKGLDTIGPAFADEIFRVFRSQHPEVNLIVHNAGDEVQRTIRRAEAGAEP